MRVISLGSGSSGNALLVEAGPQGRTRLLIDAGLSARILSRRLETVNVKPSQLTAILLTHEHSDHVSGLPVLLKYCSCPVMSDPRTLTAIEEGMRNGYWRSDTGRLIQAKQENTQTASSMQVITATRLRNEQKEATIVQTETLFQSTAITPFTAMPMVAGDRRTIGDITITSFPISHDAIAPCGYLLEAGGCRICLVTDSGEITPTMFTSMKQADLLILESNHDYDRLMRGPYPWSLKRRIMSPTGHLSNQQAATAVAQMFAERGLRWLWLAHLSRTNNTPALAVEHMYTYLRASWGNLAGLEIQALPPGLGPLWDTRRLWF